MKDLVPLLVVMLVACTRVAGREPETKLTAIDVTAEQLLKEPKRYSGKLVRVSGYWVRGFEWSNFSAAPDDRTSDIWLNHHLAPPSSPIEAQLKNAYVAAGMEWPRRDSRVLISCEGLFEHRDFKFDETKMGPGFGHLGHYSSQLSITKVLSVKPMTDLEYAFPR